MTDTDEIVAQILESLKKNDSLKRKHASFWNFHKKSSKELGLFSEFFNGFEQDCKSKITEWGLCDNDPPDVFAILSNGEKIGVEITELVNQNAINAQINKPQFYYNERMSFDFDAAVIRLREILIEKEEKVKSVVNQYHKLSLLVHTDEFMLKSEQFKGKGGYIFHQGSRFFESVYLLFSYEPDKQECPFVRLH